MVQMGPKGSFFFWSVQYIEPASVNGWIFKLQAFTDYSIFLLKTKRHGNIEHPFLPNNSFLELRSPLLCRVTGFAVPQSPDFFIFLASANIWVYTLEWFNIVIKSFIKPFLSSITDNFFNSVLIVPMTAPVCL